MWPPAFRASTSWSTYFGFASGIDETPRRLELVGSASISTGDRHGSVVALPVQPLGSVGRPGSSGKSSSLLRFGHSRDPNLQKGGERWHVSRWPRRDLQDFACSCSHGTVVIPGASARTFAGLSPSASGNNGGQPELVVLSNRADLVSGGDALVLVVLPSRVDPSTVRVSLDGRDVTLMFAVRANGAYEGVVTGLANGANDLMASMKNRSNRSSHDHESSERRTGLCRATGVAWICKTVTGFRCRPMRSATARRSFRSVTTPGS